MFSFSRELKDETATARLGAELGLFTFKGMVICLFGDLGAGKSTLARALIRSLSSSGETLEVPSPTFSLLQPYDDLRVSTFHYDLYRIAGLDEVYEIGLFDNQDERLTLIEWPQKLEGQLPENRIDVFLDYAGDHRTATLHGIGASAAVVQRIDCVSRFLNTSPWGDADRRFLQGDASARRYERLIRANGDTAILMDMPECPDGPVIKDGKTYSDIAHISEGIAPVAAINQTLCEQGFSAPVCLHLDHRQGLMLIEDFGDEVFGAMLKRGVDIDQPMTAATDLLAEMANLTWPKTATAGDDIVHHVPPFDAAAYEIEVSLLMDWFWPLVKGVPANADQRDTFLAAWRSVFAGFKTDHPVWVMRDFHSPNLIWLPERSDVGRVGLIDTQDCVIGHPAYDLVSFLQDARVDLPAGTEEKLYDHYVAQRLADDHDFDETGFRRAYAGLGAQRATKILGIFARLYKRDGKPAYLQHIPRVSAYLERNLSHPDLECLADWYEQNLPARERIIEVPK